MLLAIARTTAGVAAGLVAEALAEVSSRLLDDDARLVEMAAAAGFDQLGPVVPAQSDRQESRDPQAGEG